jgi:hypothetical protein
MGFDYYLHLFNQKVYKDKFLPAYQSLFDKDDAEPLIALLKEILERLDANRKLPGPPLESKESYKEDIGILNGTVNYDAGEDYLSSPVVTNRRVAAKQIFVRDVLAANILFALCVPRNKGVDPEQNMGRSPLVSYLYKSSSRIEDLFTTGSLRGKELEIAVGDSRPQLLAKNDINELSAELAKIPPPEDPGIRKEYDNLRSLLKLALEDSDLTLLLSLF